jgi:ABC-type Na+ efflux pump permease subunit
MGIQYLATLLLTPAYLAGVVPEQRDRKTLDTLLTTDLRNHEIILGLVLPRLLKLLLMFLVALPILSILQFLGGIEPGMLLAGFAFIALTMLSAAGVTIVVSMRAKDSLKALLKSFGIVCGYVALSGASWLLVSPLKLGGFPSTGTWISSVTLEDVIRWFSAGNLIYWIVHGVNRVNAGASIHSLILPALKAYAWFHGSIFVLSVLWVGLRLRAVLLSSPAEKNRTARPSGIGTIWLFGLNGWPAVFVCGMLWKELYGNPASRTPIRLTIGWSLLLAIVALPFLVCTYFFDGFGALGRYDSLILLINLWVRYLTFWLGSLMLLAVAGRAAGSVAGERDRGTLDSLLATPLDTKTILRSKWVGCVLSPRWSALALAVIWSVAIYARALHPLAMLSVIIVWLVLAGIAATAGMWCSVIEKTRQRAIIATVLVLPFVAVMGFPVAALPGGLSTPKFQPEWVIPPGPLFFLAFSYPDLASAESDALTIIAVVAAAAPAWILVTWAGWWLTCKQFRRIYKRHDDRYTSWPQAESWKPVELPDSDLPRVDRRAPIPWLRLATTVLLLALPACTLIAVFEYMRSQAHVALAEAIAEADRLDHPWRCNDLIAAFTDIPEEQRMAVALSMQASHSIPTEFKRDMGGDAFTYLWESPLPRQLHPLVHKHFVRALAGSEDSLGAAVQLVDLWTPRHRGMQGVAGLVWGLVANDSRDVSLLLEVAVVLEAQAGHADRAMTLCRAMINRGRANGGEALEMSIPLDSLERVLSLGEPSEAILEATQKALEQESIHPFVLEHFRCERAIVDRYFDAIIKERLSPFFLDGPARKANHDTPAWRDMDLDTLLGGSLTSQRAKLLRYYNALVEAAKLPEPEQDSAISQVGIGQMPGMARFFAGFPYGPRARYFARMRCATAALACERYRKTRGHWPDKLEELVPIYLKQIPSDPYDGKPLHLTRVSDGLVIYSVGIDRIDNGGKLDRANQPIPGTDVGFQLWDTASRRQPPGPPPKGLTDEKE